MAGLSSTKSISQLEQTTEINDSDLLFISKLGSTAESGQQNWRSYKTPVADVKAKLQQTYDERYMSVNALDDLTGN